MGNLKMSHKLKDINIKNRTYYFYNDIININFDLNNTKIDEKLYKIWNKKIIKNMKICGLKSEI